MTESVYEITINGKRYNRVVFRRKDPDELVLVNQFDGKELDVPISIKCVE